MLQGRGLLLSSAPRSPKAPNPPSHGAQSPWQWHFFGGHQLRATSNAASPSWGTTFPSHMSSHPTR